MISPISPDHEGLQAMEFPSGLEIPIDNAPQIFPIYNPLYTVDAERGEQFYGERRGDSPIPEDDHESQSEGKSGKGFDIRNLYRAGIAVLFLFVAGAALVWGVGGARIQKCTTEHTRSRASPSSPFPQATLLASSIYTSELSRPTSTLGPFLNVTRTARVVIRAATAASATSTSPTPTLGSKSARARKTLATREPQTYEPRTQVFQ